MNIDSILESVGFTNLAETDTLGQMRQTIYEKFTSTCYDYMSDVIRHL
jgi:hypothetical protein